MTDGNAMPDPPGAFDPETATIGLTLSRAAYVFAPDQHAARHWRVLRMRYEDHRDCLEYEDISAPALSKDELFKLANLQVELEDELRHRLVIGELIGSGFTMASVASTEPESGWWADANFDICNSTAEAHGIKLTGIRIRQPHNDKSDLPPQHVAPATANAEAGSIQTDRIHSATAKKRAPDLMYRKWREGFLKDKGSQPANCDADAWAKDNGFTRDSVRGLQKQYGSRPRGRPRKSGVT